MSTILDGLVGVLVGVLCLMDDLLIFEKDQKEHDDRLAAALKRIQAADITLNKDKCESLLMEKESLLIPRKQQKSTRWLQISLLLS